MLRITEEQVEGSLDISTSIDLTRDAYRLQATGKVLNPSRALLIVPGGVSLYCMPAHALASNASKKYHVTVIAAKSSLQVLESSDVLVLATSSSLPLFDGRLVKPGTHVNAVGAALPTTREVDSYLVQHSILFVDSRDQALSTYGDILIPIREGVIEASHIRGELGDLMIRPGLFSRRKDDITLFKSGGIAALDAVFAEHLVKLLGK